MSADDKELFYKLFILFIGRRLEVTQDFDLLQREIERDLIYLGHPKEIARIASCEYATIAHESLKTKNVFVDGPAHV